MAKPSEVVPYDSNWPIIYEAQSQEIQKALGDNCIEIHHIGSTSVPGLSAKPKIDIIAVVKNGSAAIQPLVKLGFTYKGEWNVPFKYGFTKRDAIKVNLHVFEENHPEIELNLLFRDHLRSNPESLAHYAKLKEELLSDENAFKKQEGFLFPGYTLGKDLFIREILKKSGFSRHRFLRVTHFEEWENYHRICKKQLFDPNNVPYDPNHWTIRDEKHIYFALCIGVQVATVAHVELLSQSNVALRALATDLPYQNKGLGNEMMIFLEKWLRRQGTKVIKVHSTVEAEHFFRSIGYQECYFDDSCIFENIIDLCKAL